MNWQSFHFFSCDIEMKIMICFRYVGASHYIGGKTTNHGIVEIKNKNSMTRSYTQFKDNKEILSVDILP